MRSPSPHLPSPSRTLTALIVLAAALLLAASAFATPAPQGKAQHAKKKHARTPGTLVQLAGPSGCLADRSAHNKSCGPARALQGPAPFLGSRAVALSPDGRNLYVASSESDAIAVFVRNPKTGALKQGRGIAGCIAAQGAGGCAPAVGLDGPNSVAVSPDGANVYATSVDSQSLAIFQRDPKTGALLQRFDGSGCISGLPLPGCLTGRALVGPDVVIVSPNGANVYVGSFFGNEIAMFNRDASSGALTQPTDSSGCIAETSAAGCAIGIALKSPEGLAVSGDGTSVYAATALSNALVVLNRNSSTGALSQATDGSGCIVQAPLAGCTTGVQLSGANAVAVSPDDEDVYVTSLFSNSVTSFSRSSGGAVTQKAGTAGCLVFMRAPGCSFGRAIKSPEGLAISPEGTNVYATAFSTGAVDVLSREGSGAIAQVPLKGGCVGPRSAYDCSSGRGLGGVSSAAVSADGRFVYAAAFKSDAISVFRRIAAPKHR